MNEKQSLKLHEEVMLLALHDDKGTVTSESYAYAVGGAILAELLLTGRLRVREDGKKQYVELESSQPTGDAIVDECLEKVVQATRRATVQTWVERFASVKQLKHRIAEQLCRRDILRADEDKVLWIFTRKIYPEFDPGPERALIDRLRKAIFTDTSNVDPRTVVLISLGDGANLLRHVFDGKELNSRKDRIKQLVDGELSGRAAKAAIEAMQAAVAAAVVTSVIMSSTINHS